MCPWMSLGQPSMMLEGFLQELNAASFLWCFLSRWSFSPFHAFFLGEGLQGLWPRPLLGCVVLGWGMRCHADGGVLAFSFESGWTTPSLLGHWPGVPRLGSGDFDSVMSCSPLFLGGCLVLPEIVHGWDSRRLYVWVGLGVCP